MNRRFLLTILGPSNGIDKDLNFIADGETGVNFVDGKGVFICTFFSTYTVTEIHEKLANRPAIMIFDITDPDTYGVNLPPKYYMGIFPEIQKTMESIQEKWGPVKTSTKEKVLKEEKHPTVEIVVLNQHKKVLKNLNSHLLIVEDGMEENMYLLMVI